MKKIILTILLIVVVAGVSGGGVYLWQKEITRKQINNTISSPSNTTQANANNTLQTTNNKVTSSNGFDLAFWNQVSKVNDKSVYAWKEYSNADYSITFNYPSDLDIKKAVSASVAPDSLLSFALESKDRAYPGLGWTFYPSSFGFYVKKSDKTIDQDLLDIETNYKKGMFPDFVMKKDNVKIGDFDWVEYTLPASESATTYYRLDKNGYAYVFNISSMVKQDAGVLEMIISSFNFTK